MRWGHDEGDMMRAARALRMASHPNLELYTEKIMIIMTDNLDSKAATKKR
jgi:hypothetical protein